MERFVVIIQAIDETARASTWLLRPDSGVFQGQLYEQGLCHGPSSLNFYGNPCRICMPSHQKIAAL
jgi:hypothetical protein